ncbi:MAG: hypothetical protein PF444_03000 [Bacteroidales bacterium]|nr:hypothetical protein [Bacteroidales bacterium]
MDYKSILDDEKELHNPLFINGMSGILMLLTKLSSFSSSQEIEESLNDIYDRLLHFVTHHERYEKEYKPFSGILKGWAGIGLALLYFESNKPQIINNEEV